MYRRTLPKVDNLRSASRWFSTSKFVVVPFALRKTRVESLIEYVPEPVNSPGMPESASVLVTVSRPVHVLSGLRLSGSNLVALIGDFS